MPVIFNLTTPVNVGTLTQPVVVSSLKVTSVWFSTTPDLAPLGAAELSITLTDPASGWQETIDYKDASVPVFFAQSAPTPPTGTTYEDVMAVAVFMKLIADGKLPAGSLSTPATPTPDQSSTPSN
jgi:hypothetical protein